MRHADAALVQAAIALCDEATADERARFYALARRGRPHADADVGRTVDLLHRGTSYRLKSARPRRAATASRSTARDRGRPSSSSPSTSAGCASPGAPTAP